MCACTSSSDSFLSASACFSGDIAVNRACASESLVSLPLPHGLPQHILLASSTLNMAATACSSSSRRCDCVPIPQIIQLSIRNSQQSAYNTNMPHPLSPDRVLPRRASRIVNTTTGGGKAGSSINRKVPGITSQRQTFQRSTSCVRVALPFVATCRSINALSQISLLARLSR